MNWVAFFSSKKVKALIAGILITFAAVLTGDATWIMFAQKVGYMIMSYIFGQSLVDFAKFLPTKPPTE